MQTRLFAGVNVGAAVVNTHNATSLTKKGIATGEPGKHSERESLAIFIVSLIEILSSLVCPASFCHAPVGLLVSCNRGDAGLARKRLRGREISGGRHPPPASGNNLRAV
jgi:hypothetical protein